MLIHKRRKAQSHLGGGPWATYKDFSHSPTELDSAIKIPDLSQLCVSIASSIVPPPSKLAKRFEKLFGAPPGISWTPEFAAEVFIAVIGRHVKTMGLIRKGLAPRIRAVDANGRAYYWTTTRWRALIYQD